MKKKLYNILTSVTVVLPTVVYLYLSATILNIQYDYVATFDKDVVVSYYEWNYTEQPTLFYFSATREATFEGDVEWNNTYKAYGLYLKEGDILKENKDFRIVERNADTRELELVDINKFAIQTKESINLPVATMISIFAAVVVIMIKTGKMGFLKKYRRLSVFLSLLIGTLILYGIDMIVSNMLNVFLVALASWTVYCIEYLVAMGFDKDKRLEEKEKLLKEKGTN